MLKLFKRPNLNTTPKTEVIIAKTSSIKDHLKEFDAYCHNEPESSNLKNILHVSFLVLNEFKREEWSLQDITKLLHPNEHDFRRQMLQMMLNRRQILIQELSQLKLDIQSMQKDKDTELKDTYRAKSRRLKDIEHSIKPLENYYEFFINENKRTSAFKTYHPLFLFLDEQLTDNNTNTNR